MLELKFNPFAAFFSLYGYQTFIFKQLHLEELPSSITRIERLEKLDISHTRVSKLPDNFNQLKNLKELVITNTQISKSDIEEELSLLSCQIIK